MNLFAPPVPKETFSGDPDTQFDLKQRLGRGQFGTVFKALHLPSKKEYAVKIIELTEHEGDRKMIEKEVEIVSKCSSPFIVKHFGCLFKLPCIWIVMEFCNAGSVTDVMRKIGRPLNEPECAAILKQVLYAVNYIHAIEPPICHRDIKCGNILLNSKGEAKLADFGVAAQTSSSLRTQIGSPYWMAPEMLPLDDKTPQPRYDLRVDIWALGITAMEMAQGKPPYVELGAVRALLAISTKDPPTLDEPQRFTREFNGFLRACLQKLPTMRYTARDLIHHPWIMNAPDKNYLAEFLESVFKFSQNSANSSQLDWMQYLTETKTANPSSASSSSSSTVANNSSLSQNGIPLSTSSETVSSSSNALTSPKGDKDKDKGDKSLRNLLKGLGPKKQSSSPNIKENKIEQQSQSQSQLNSFSSAAKSASSENRSENKTPMDSNNSRSPYMDGRFADSPITMQKSHTVASFNSNHSNTSNNSSITNSNTASTTNNNSTTINSNSNTSNTNNYQNNYQNNNTSNSNSSSPTLSHSNSSTTNPSPLNSINNNTTNNTNNSTANNNNSISSSSNVNTPALQRTSTLSASPNILPNKDTPNASKLKISNEANPLPQSPPQSPPRAIPNVPRSVSPLPKPKGANYSSTPPNNTSISNYGNYQNSTYNLPPMYQPMPVSKTNQNSSSLSVPLTNSSAANSLSGSVMTNSNDSSLNSNMNSTNNSNNSGNIPMITSTSPQPQVTFASAPVSPHTGMMHFHHHHHPMGVAPRIPGDESSRSTSHSHSANTSGMPTPLRVSQPISAADSSWHVFFQSCDFPEATCKKYAELFAQHDIELAQADDINDEILGALGLSSADSAKILSRIAAESKEVFK